MRVDNDPDALTEEQAEAALHLSHPYGRPVIGWPDEIRHIGRAKPRFLQKPLRAERRDPDRRRRRQVDEVRADAEAEYGDSGFHELAVRADYAQPPRLGETRLAIARKDAKVPLFLRLYRVESYAQAAPGRAEALDVLADFLGGDTTSAFYRRLVVERRLVTDSAPITTVTPATPASSASPRIRVPACRWIQVESRAQMATLPRR